MKQNKLIAYAQDFVSFLIENYEKTDLIDEIILFGSVASLRANADSNIDIFVNTKHSIETDLIFLVDKFYESVKFKRYWKLQGIDLQISIKTGNLDKWELKRSIISNGITLFSKYSGKTKTKAYTLFILDVDGNRAQKVKIWRKIYGYQQKTKNKVYMINGIMQKLNGNKLGPSVFIIPLNHTQKMIKFLKDNKVQHKLMDFWTDAYVQKKGDIS